MGVQYKDYYRILGVDRKAGEQEIKQAYRKLARQYHPDVNPGDKQAEAHFKDINEAYEVLSDREKRAKYDRFGNGWQQYNYTGGTSGASDFDRGPFTGDNVFSDFFDALFGSMNTPGAGAPHRPPGTGGFSPGVNGQDIEHAVDITLEEAFQGTQRTVRVRGADGAPRTIKARIPTGADTGTRIRIAGEGAPSIAGGRRGDLMLLVRILPHDRFTRDGDDLTTHVQADLYTLLLGGAVQVSTLNGKMLTLNIPANTPNGKVFRLGEQGMPQLRCPEKRGDLYITVNALLPSHLSQRERELFEELRRMWQGTGKPVS